MRVTNFISVLTFRIGWIFESQPVWRCHGLGYWPGRFPGHFLQPGTISSHIPFEETPWHTESRYSLKQVHLPTLHATTVSSGYDPMGCILQCFCSRSCRAGQDARYSTLQLQFFVQHAPCSRSRFLGVLVGCSGKGKMAKNGLPIVSGSVTGSSLR